MGFGVWGLGFRVWGLGFRVWHIEAQASMDSENEEMAYVVGV